VQKIIVERNTGGCRMERGFYDVTAEQYYSVGQLPPHQNGKKSKWYGWKGRPQQISLDLMVRVLGERLIEDTLITVH
jgi:hypothetical protein